MISYSTSVIFFTLLQYLQTSEANHTLAHGNLWDSSVRFADEGESEWFKLAAVGMKEYEYDWNAAVPFCSGVLITKKHVVTLAHCVKEIHVPNVIRIRMGMVNLLLADIYHISYWTTYNIWAEENGIESGPYEHDICIIKLSDKAFGFTIPGVITKEPIEYFYNKSVEILFWGIKDGVPGYAKIGTSEVISFDECKKTLNRTALLPKKITLDPWILCTKINRGVILEDVDSGSPLLYKKNQVIAVTDPTYLQRKGVHVSVDLDFHVGLGYYKTFIKSVTKTEKAKWWKVWRQN